MPHRRERRSESHTSAGRAHAPGAPADTRSSEGGHAPRILIVGADPYLSFLISADLPAAVIGEASDRVSLDRELAANPDLMVADLRTPLGADAVSRERDQRTVGIVDGYAKVPPGRVDRLVVRPFAPHELLGAVRRVLHIPDTGSHGRSVQRDRTQEILAFSRPLMAAIGAVLELANPGPSPMRAVIAAAVFAFCAISVLPQRRSPGRGSAWLDTVFTALVVAGTGGISSNFIGVGAVVAVHAGLVLGPAPGAFAGAILGIASIQPGAVYTSTVGPRVAVGWAIVFPLASLAGGLAGRMWRQESPSSVRLLDEANQVLQTLYRIAHTLPGALDVRAVADAVMGQMRQGIGAPAGLFLVTSAAEASVAGHYGVSADGLRSLPPPRELADLPTVLQPATLPTALHRLLSDHACWLYVPVNHGTGRLGALLAACPGHERHESARVVLRGLADEAALSLENARLFAAVRAMSADHERRRLADELHDSVAQSLAHIRMELDFLAKHPSDTGAEAARLARVAEGAVTEVRGMITGLVQDGVGDVVTSLRSYLHDLQGLGGPSISLDARGELQLGPAARTDVFRVVQEAVSNALRHSGASHVRVSVQAVGDGWSVAVIDDGCGGAADRPDGHGRRTMRERATRLGARLECTTRRGAGTRVELKWPAPHVRMTV